ncbi:hypothetical protein V8E36_001942 [Tilletia maclaganii]
MKFAQYLEDASVPEWRRSYVNYGGIKKLIKRVAEHRTQRLSLELDRTISAASKSRTGHEHGPVSLPLGLARRTSSAVGANATGFFSHRKPTYGATGTPSGRGPHSGPDLEANRKLEPISLEGTGLHIDEDKLAALHSCEHSDAPASAPDHSQGGEGGQHSSEPQSQAQPSSPTGPSAAQTTDAEGNNHVRFQREGQGSSTSVSRPAVDRDFSTRSLRARSTQAANNLVHRLKQTKSAYPENLNQIIEETFDDEEAKIFLALESEIQRVISFLEAREKQALERFEVLALQLQELAQHRLGFKAREQGTAAKKAGSDGFNLAAVSSHFNRLGATASAVPARVRSNLDGIRGSGISPEGYERRGTGSPATPPSADGAQPSYWDEGAERRSQALSRIPHFTHGHPLTPADEEIRRANEAAALSHDPERYRSAKKKMKVAVLEEYRLLELVKDFRILNRTALAKALKKLQKQTGVHCSDAFFEARVAPTMLVKSERIEKLLKSTEELYTYFFEHGDRKKARDRLRASNAFATLGSTIPHQSHHISVFKAGIYMGVALCATVAGLVESQRPATKQRLPQRQALLRVYGALFIPTLFAFLFGLNLAAWRRTRVNYVFIFEFDVRTLADYHQFFELPALFLLLLSVCFWISFLDPFPAAIAPTTWPLVWTVIVIVVLLLPFRVFLKPSRTWFIRSLLRVFQAGILSRVEFRDFFLGDELNSLVWSFSMLWFIGCQYHRKWPAVDSCDPNKTFWTPVLGALPPFLRFVQCWRRWFDSDMKARIHLVNAGKYTSSVLNQFFYFNYRYHGSGRTVDLALWCAFGCIYSIYTSSWDLKIDWSLLNPNARWPYLRDDLLYEWPALYYFAIVSNVIGRFAWMIYLLPGPASPLLRVFIIALIEALRRWQWNMYRLENEHIGNADDFRVVKDVPLPYSHGARVAEEDLDDDDDDSIKIKKRRDAFKLSETFKHKDSADELSDAEPFARHQANGSQDTQVGVIERLSQKLSVGLDESQGESSGQQIGDIVGAKGSTGRDYEPPK